MNSNIRVGRRSGVSSCSMLARPQEMSALFNTSAVSAQVSGCDSLRNGYRSGLEKPGSPE